jgi:hypothetical protein
VYAFSPRDGGWVQLSIGGRTEEQAWQAALMLWDLLVLTGDYVSIDAKGTIRFR